MRRRVALPLGLTFLLAACGLPSATGGGAAGIAHPAGVELVLGVENRGGFVPIEWAATSMPSFTLLGDGRVIVRGAEPLIFPGPALPALQVRTLTEEGIQTILEAVTETRLFDDDLELRGAAMMIADAPDTVFILHAAGREVTVSVYGLGTLDPTVPQQGVSAAEQAAHRTLATLNEHLTLLEDWLPESAFADSGWQPYQPEALRLYVRDVTAQPIDEPGMPPTVARPWPVDDDPATFGEPVEWMPGGTCAVVDGEAAATWLEELAQADQLTRWTLGGATYSILPRPLLPHEERACPDFVAGA